MQSGEFLGNPLSAKSILILLGLMAAADAGIHKTILRLGTTTLIISSKEMKDIVKKVKYLVESGL